MKWKNYLRGGLFKSKEKLNNPELNHSESSNPELSNPELNNIGLDEQELDNPELNNPERSKMVQEKTSRQGCLVLIGGAEDKIYDKVVLQSALATNNAKSIVVIPTASYRYANELGVEYTDVFRNLGASRIDVLDIRKSEEAREERHVEKVKQADLIFFTGGDQLRLSEILNHTPVLDTIRKRHLEGATIAGTSAGAAAASDPMIYDGDRYGFQKGTVNSSEGFGFLEGITVDTHFVKRGRIARLIQFLARKPRQQYAIGLAEDTAIIVDPKKTAEVVGSGVVMVLSGETLNYSNYHEIEDNERITVDGLRLGVLASGAKFDLNSWRLIDKKPPQLAADNPEFQSCA